MDILEKSKLEWQLMMEMREFYIEGDNNSLIEIKEKALIFYVDSENHIKKPSD